MSYEFYKILHFVGIAMVLLALGAQISQSLQGIAKSDFKARKLVSISHGLGLTFILVAGFGLLARLHIGVETWVIGKLLIWLILGGLSALIWRRPKAVWWYVIIVAVGLGAWLARVKPF